jgi:AraC-like DNA-binding protein
MHACRLRESLSDSNGQADPAPPLRKLQGVAGEWPRYGEIPAIPVPRNGNEDFAIRRTKRFLDEHYAERVSLHELARLVGLSAYHLNRTFRRKIGMPPHEYQVQVRIIKAKSFLRLGRSISETVSLVGFVDQSHFTRHFKRSVGVTPGKFLL